MNNVYKLFLAKLYLKKYLTFLIIIFIIYVIFNSIMLPEIKSLNPNKISLNLIYYQGKKIENYKNYAIDNGLEYSMSPKLDQKDAFKIDEQVIKEVYLYDLKYLNETTRELIENNLNTLNLKNEKFISLYAQFNFFPQQIDKYKILNSTLRINSVLYGNYPHSEQEVMIPEIYAIYLANEEGLSNYASLIGKDIKLNMKPYGYEEDFKITGIYNGGYDFVFYPSSEIIKKYENFNYEGIFIEFSNVSQKIKFFNEFPKDEFANTSDYLLNNVLMILPKIFDFLIIVMTLIILSKEQKKYIDVLNFYNYSYINYFIPLIIPFGVVLGMIYVF